MVAFKINSPIRIKSKSAGKDPSLWGVEVNGREGYVPKEYIRETKIFIKERELKFEVDVKPSMDNSILSTSENFVKENPVVLTATKPLGIIHTESIKKPLSKMPSVASEIESVTQATLLDLVDGTQIPVEDNESHKNMNIVANNSEKLGKDFELYNDIGDYDEDEDAREFDKSHEIEVLDENKERVSQQNIISKDNVNKKGMENHVKQQDHIEENSQNNISKDSMVSNDSFTLTTTNMSNKREVQNVQVEESIQEEKPIISSYSPKNDSENESYMEESTLNVVNSQTTDESKNSQEEIVQVYQRINEENPITLNNFDNIKIESHTEESKVTLAKNKDIEEGKTNTQEEDVQVELNKPQEQSIILKNSEREIFSEELIVDLIQDGNIDENKPAGKENDKIEHNVEEQLMNSNNADTDPKVDPEFENLKNDNDENSLLLQISTQEKTIVSQHVEIDSPNLKIADDESCVGENNGKSQNRIENLSGLSKPNKGVIQDERESFYYSTISPFRIQTKESVIGVNAISVEEQFYKQAEKKVEESLPSISQANRKEETDFASVTTEGLHTNPYEHQSKYENTDYEHIGITENAVSYSDLENRDATVEYTNTESSENTDYKYIGITENPISYLDLENRDARVEYANTQSSETVVVKDTSKFDENQASAPSILTPPSEHLDIKQNKGLFATIIGTVNNVLSMNNKMKYNSNEDNLDFDKVLFSGQSDNNVLKSSKEGMYENIWNKN